LKEENYTAHQKLYEHLNKAKLIVMIKRAEIAAESVPASVGCIGKDLPPVPAKHQV
jgi:hypothetical protein